ncbi:hypothetical protein [Streptomyces sp. NPDC057363]|uniref:hypothetical protein n=1 Tax=Streptomyces sp. NPDC057363 TaxID=3346107 RepID=UPI003629DA8E
MRGAGPADPARGALCTCGVTARGLRHRTSVSPVRGGPQWPAARPSVPKPGPPPARERWFQPRRSGHAWEREGLDHVRQRRPKAEPYRAWATLQFTGASGRVSVCDLLIAVPGGVYLLEL